MRRKSLSTLLVVFVFWTCAAIASPRTINLVTRSQTPKSDGKYEVLHKVSRWDPRKTALIICDMWDKHWCSGASQRVDEMAPAINEVAKEARKNGVLIIHAPSETMSFYQDMPQRKRVLQTPISQIPTNLSGPSTQAKELLPIDDSKGGCDTDERPWHRAWTRENPAIEVAPEDAITDNGKEVYNLLVDRGIDNVIYVGVHTNMCILNRSFAIRRMVSWGKNVVLMRDLTDSMYDPRQAPFVSHFRGTDLVLDYIEKHWCPTITSTDFTGRPAFRFHADKRPHIVLVLSEDEYNAKETLAGFAQVELEQRLGYRCTILQSDSKTDIPGLQALKDADLALIYIRRRTLPPDQMAYIKGYLYAGKPLVALRTSSHAFQNWPEFDAEVLGGHYHGHFNNKNADGSATYVRAIPEVAAHPILTGVPKGEFRVASWLYKVLPLAVTTVPLVTGRVQGQDSSEPVAWVNTDKGRRLFYTSLGHPDDFKLEPFRRLLLNGVLWALSQPIQPFTNNAH